MNENRMKTSVNTAELSPLLAQATPWGRKIGGDEVIVTKTLHFVPCTWLAIASDGRTIAKMTGEIKFAP